MRGEDGFWLGGCIEVCRQHWNLMRIEWEIQEWRIWGYPDWRNPWERHAADTWRFWFMRASF